MGNFFREHKEAILVIGSLAGIIGLIVLVMGKSSGSNGTTTQIVPVGTQGGSGTDTSSSANDAISSLQSTITSALSQQQANEANAAATQQQNEAQSLAALSANDQQYQQAQQATQQQQQSAYEQSLQAFQQAQSQQEAGLQADLANALHSAIPAIAMQQTPAYAPPQPTYNGGNGGSVAADGQSLASQTNSVQKLFNDTFGSGAATEWVKEHNQAIGA